jgi:hypothetical protein
MTRTAEIRSARDGLVLTLSNFVHEDSSALSESFLASIKKYEIQAETRVSSFMAPSLGVYFQDLANSWRGWKGEKKWATFEGEFEFTASCDSLGHVRLGVYLRSPHTGFHSELRTTLELEAGQLDSIAREVSAAWDSDGAA